MTRNHNKDKPLFVGLGLLVVAAVLVSWTYDLRARGGLHKTRQVNSHDFGSKMIEDIKQGRYNDAVQVGLQALRNEPGDEIVYQQIANVYLIRAQKEPAQRGQWLAKAVSYLEKALSLNSKDRDVAGVHLFLDAQDFELAGDLSTNERCTYYKRATSLLEDRVPMLKGDQFNLEGKTYSLAPLREENERTLAQVKVKAAKSNCK